MVPESFAAITTFLLVLTPGLVFNIRRERLRPTAEESAFREASGIVLASLLAGSVAMAVLAGAKALWPGLLPDPAEWVKEGAAYAAVNLDRVAAFFVLYSLIAALVAWVGGWVLYRSGGEAFIDPHTNAWFEAFRRRVPAGTTPMALVELEDSVQYAGEVVYYAVNMATEEREIMLGPPLWRRGATEADLSPLPAEDQWRRVIIPGNRIASVWVRYPPLVPPAAVQRIRARH